MTAGAPGIRAIETRYNGYRFRSRLEARWAVFFDALGVRWEYEAQGFGLSAGAYLPDFWLPGWEYFAEVKPRGVRPAADGREVELVGRTYCSLLWLAGVPEVTPYRAVMLGALERGEIVSDWIDFGVSFDDRRPRLLGDALGARTAWRKLAAIGRRRFLHAVTRARGARFEHGEGQWPR